MGISGGRRARGQREPHVRHSKGLRCGDREWGGWEQMKVVRQSGAGSAGKDFNFDSE